MTGLSDHSRPERTIVVILWVILAVRGLLTLLSLHWGQPLGWDEIEFFRASDWIRQGRVPFRDFWEHHSPLQWFLFAPVTGLTKSAGVNAVILLRYAQIPVWIASLAVVDRWMRDARVSLWARLASITAAVLSTPFIYQAVEYRVEAFPTLLLLLGIVLFPHVDRAWWVGLLIGGLFCLSGLGNLRLGPVLAVTALLMQVVSPNEKRWQGSSKRAWIFAGVGLTLAIFVTYLLVTGSAADAWRCLVVDNFQGDKLMKNQPLAFVKTMVAVAGLPPLAPVHFRVGLLDFGALMLWIAGLFMMFRVLITRLRAPDIWFVLALIQFTNLLFIARMKVIYYYHFGSATLLMIPFLALMLDEAAARYRDRVRVIAGGFVTICGVALFLGAVHTFFLSGERDLLYQDAVMKEAHRRSSPDDVVFDGVGFAIRREPAYRHWFLPYLVRVLVASGTMEPYSREVMLRRPPAVAIMNIRSAAFVGTQDTLRADLTSHYLPLTRNLWIPGLSGVLTPESPVREWIAPVDGRYRLYGSPQLAAHPWFTHALTFAAGRPPHEEAYEIDLQQLALPGGVIEWRVDGISVSPSAVGLSLRRGQRVEAKSRVLPMALLLVPGDDRLLLQPIGERSIDGAAFPRQHHPDFTRLFEQRPLE